MRILMLVICASLLSLAASNSFAYFDEDINVNGGKACAGTYLFCFIYLFLLSAECYEILLI